MKELIIFLQQNYDENLSIVFERFHGKVTEFFLYFAFLHKLNIIDKYIDNPFSCRTFFAIYPSDYGQVDKMLRNLDKDGIKILGLHRKRLNQLSVEHKDLLNNIVKEDLLYCYENIDWFIDAKNQSSI